MWCICNDVKYYVIISHHSSSACRSSSKQVLHVWHFLSLDLLLCSLRRYYLTFKTCHYGKLYLKNVQFSKSFEALELKNQLMECHQTLNIGVIQGSRELIRFGESLACKIQAGRHWFSSYLKFRCNITLSCCVYTEKIWFAIQDGGHLSIVANYWFIKLYLLRY